MNGPRERGRPGEDAADRAFDDALALANGPRGGIVSPASPASSASPDAPAFPAGDPLAVALDHEPARRGAPQDTAYEAGPASAPGPGGGEREGASARGEDEAYGGAPRPGAAAPGAGLPGRGSVHRAAQPYGSASAPGADQTSDTAGRAHGRAFSAARPPNPNAAPRENPSPAAPPTPWRQARQIARQARPTLGARSLPLGDGVLGMALAAPLTARSDLPSFDSSAMDGWAVAGPGPWRVRDGAGLLAGQRRPAEALHSGHAVRIATGAVLPPGATAVLRSEHGTVARRTDGEWLRVAPPHPAPRPGQETRRRGQECRSGDELLPPGALVTPAVLGLAAAAGHDELSVVLRPRVEVLVLGDELLDQGPPRGGRVRDALGPMLPSWLRGLGADVTAVHRLKDDADLLHAALRASSADLVITTGGTAGGPVDHVHPVLARLGARLLVDGVAVRPGHPMLLAELPAGPLLAGLPGNPLAAVSGVLTLVAPALRTLAGRPEPAPYAAPLTEDVTGHPVDTRLVPVVFDDDSAARPLHYAGPAMLRGLAAADGIAVIPPGGAAAGQEAAVLDTGALSPA